MIFSLLIKTLEPYQSNPKYYARRRWFFSKNSWKKPISFLNCLVGQWCGRPVLTNGKRPKTVLDSRFHAVDSRFHVLDSGFFVSEIWIRIPIVSGIPDSLSCLPDSKAQDSGFHKQKFHAVSGIRIPFHAVKTSYASWSLGGGGRGTQGKSG